AGPTRAGRAHRPLGRRRQRRDLRLRAGPGARPPRTVRQRVARRRCGGGGAGGGGRGGGGRGPGARPGGRAGAAPRAPRGARTPRALLYPDARLGWGRDADVEVTVDSAGGDWLGHVGVVAKLVAGARFRPERTTAFVCGPEIMMRFTVEALLEHGLAPERIFL